VDGVKRDALIGAGCRIGTPALLLFSSGGFRRARREGGAEWGGGLVGDASKALPPGNSWAQDRSSLTRTGIHQGCHSTDRCPLRGPWESEAVSFYRQVSATRTEIHQRCHSTGSCPLRRCEKMEILTAEALRAQRIRGEETDSFNSSPGLRSPNVIF